VAFLLYPSREYPEGWAEGAARDRDLEYRLTIENAQSEDSGTYSCVTPTRHSHQIKVIIKGSFQITNAN
jgi:hypothetical protein